MITHRQHCHHRLNWSHLTTEDKGRLVAEFSQYVLHMDKKCCFCVSHVLKQGLFFFFRGVLNFNEAKHQSLKVAPAMRRTYGIYRQLKEIAASRLMLQFSKSLKCTVKLQRDESSPHWACVHLPVLSEGLKCALKKRKAIFMGFTQGWAESRPFY